MADYGRFYLRVEHDEWPLIEEVSGDPPFDAAIVSARYLAPYTSQSPRFGSAPDQLSRTLTDHAIVWLLDPSTPDLVHPSFPKRNARKRAGNSPFAKVLPLPLTTTRLKDEAAAEAFVDAGTGMQLTSGGFAAPYLEAPGTKSDEHKVNRMLVRLAAGRAGDRPVIAYLQVTKKLLLDGTALSMAIDLTQEGAQLIAIRVRRFEPEQASVDETLSYMDLVSGIHQVGSHAVPDCTGRLGPILISAGAHAFATNAQRFRKVPDDLLPRGGGSSPALTYEVPGQLFGLTKSNLLGDLPPCPVSACPANGGQGDNRGIRIHDLHEFRTLARAAGAGKLHRVLEQSRAMQATTWAHALGQFQDRQRRAA